MAKRILKEEQLIDVIWGATLMGGGGGGAMVGGTDLLDTYKKLHPEKPVELTLLETCDMDPEAYGAVTAGMGAPTVLKNVDFSQYAVNAFNALKEMGAKMDPPRKLEYSVPVELGGFNTFCPMLISLLNDIPFIDCDGAGRAVPALDTLLLHINGLDTSPLAMADGKNNKVSPDQLHLYLMDFKSGTEFKIYESVKLPHIQLLALDAMQEFGESILENLVSEMEHRGSLFKEAGQTSLKGYKQATGKPLPRILVIMDEFQILFNDSTNRKVAMNCAELTKRIVTEGRAFGIHLLMATQSTKVISDLTLSHGTIEQMRIRIGLKCGENDARYLFSDQNDTKALAMMKGPIGTAVMNLDYTEQPNIGFRAAYCDDDTQKYYLDLISKTYAEQPSTLQTFEGSRTTNLIDYFANANIGVTSELPAQIHMGTLIKVAPPFAICIDKKKKHNLLICGSNERMANTVSNNYMISALLNRNATVYCIDGDKLVGDDGSAEFYDALGECSTQFKVAQDRADIIKFINEIYQNYQSWKKQNSDDVIFVVIKNLQFLDILIRNRTALQISLYT